MPTELSKQSSSCLFCGLILWPAYNKVYQIDELPKLNADLADIFVNLSQNSSLSANALTHSTVDGLHPLLDGLHLLRRKGFGEGG